MAAPPPVSRASALVPRCHSIRGLGALAPAGTNQQAQQASRASQDGPWAVTSCSSGDRGGPWLVFFSLASQCFFPWVLFVPHPVCFPRLDSPCSVEKSCGGPREVTALQGGQGTKPCCHFTPLLPPPAPSPPTHTALEQSLDGPGRTLLALG